MVQACIHPRDSADHLDLIHRRETTPECVIKITIRITITKCHVTRNVI